MASHTCTHVDLYFNPFTGYCSQSQSRKRKSAHWDWFIFGTIKKQPKARYVPPMFALPDQLSFLVSLQTHEYAVADVSNC